MGGMDEKPKPKFRFSLRAALAAMLVIAIGVALLRIAAHDPVVIVAVVPLSVLTACALLAYVLGRDPMDGVPWAVLILGVIIAAAMLMPAVHY